jgi:hypothetical protein
VIVGLSSASFSKSHAGLPPAKLKKILGIYRRFLVVCRMRSQKWCVHVNYFRTAGDAFSPSFQESYFITFHRTGNFVMCGPTSALIDSVRLL